MKNSESIVEWLKNSALVPVQTATKHILFFAQGMSWFTLLIYWNQKAALGAC